MLILLIFNKLIMNKSLISNERIASKIVLLRDEKIMLDVHLAELYGTDTRTLKQAVRRNIDRFPEDFMFKLTLKEIDALVSQKIIPSKQYLGGATPFAFTETGVAMLSSVLKSKLAVEVNIAIMRTFVMLRRVLFNYKDLLKKQDEILQKIADHDDIIMLIFEYLKQLEQDKKEEIDFKKRRKVGFKRINDEENE